jgi:hypothetical protein
MRPFLAAKRVDFAGKQQNSGFRGNQKTIGGLEGILLYLRDTLTRKPKVGSVCGLSN